MSDIPILTPKDPPGSPVSSETPDLDQNTAFLGNKLNELSGSLKDFGSSISSSILGDVSFITQPFKQIGDITKKTFSLFKGKDKEKRVPPKRDVLLKKGVEGSGSVYIVDSMKKIFGAEKDGEEGGGLKGLLSGIFGTGAAGLTGIAAKMFPKLMKILPLAAIAGGIIWGVIDAIKAIGMADEWGVSKIQAAIGGFLGGTESGWKNAFKNAGKWALMGVGIGFLVGGPVGGLVGGLIGAVVGGILGFFGGEAIAKFLKKIPAIFVDLWKSITDAWERFKQSKVFTLLRDTFLSLWDFIKAPFEGIIEAVEGIIERFKTILEGDDPVLVKIGKFFTETILVVPRLIFGWFKGLFTGIVGLFQDIFIGQEDEVGERNKPALISLFGEAIGDFAKKIGKGIVTIAGKLWDGFLQVGAGIFSQAYETIAPIIEWTNDNIIKPVQSFFFNVFEGIRDVTKNIWDTVTGWTQEKVIDPIKDWFSGVKDAIVNFVQDPLDFIREPFEKFKESISKIFYTIGDFFGFIGSISIIDLIKGINLREQQEIYTLEKQKERERIVNDAIITSSGQIIKTNPNDTIIATQNDTEVINDMNNIQSLMKNNLLEQLNINLENLINRGNFGQQNNPTMTTINPPRTISTEQVMENLIGATP